MGLLSMFLALGFSGGAALLSMQELEHTFSAFYLFTLMSSLSIVTLICLHSLNIISKEY